MPIYQTRHGMYRTGYGMVEEILASIPDGDKDGGQQFKAKIKGIVSNRIKLADHLREGVKVGNADALRREVYEMRTYEVKTKTPELPAEPGRVIKSLRPFGIELEALGRDNASPYICALTHEPLWRACGDSSIRGRNGFELKTRSTLVGKSGEQEIKKTCRALRRECTINHSCGLHIHLDVSGMINPSSGGTVMAQVLKSYVLFEDVIQAMLPKYRRANQHARLTRLKYAVGDLDNVETIKDLQQLWYKTTNDEAIKDYHRNRYNSSRYWGVNLHNALANERKAVEIRYHSPTLQPDKIIRWVALNQAILDRAPKINRHTKRAAEALFLEDKIKVFFDFLARPDLEKYIISRIKLFNPRCAV